MFLKNRVDAGRRIGSPGAVFRVPLMPRVRGPVRLTAGALAGFARGRCVRTSRPSFSLPILFQ
jgi:hypothetical protein